MSDLTPYEYRVLARIVTGDPDLDLPPDAVLAAALESLHGEGQTS